MRRTISLLLLALMLTYPVAATQYITPENGANQSIGVGNLLFLDNTNGYVGIGTATPNTALYVREENFTGTIATVRTTGATNNPGLFFLVNETGSKSSIISSGTTGALDLGIGAGGTEVITVTGAGRVGIGNQNPSQRFAVQTGDVGTIQSTFSIGIDALQRHPSYYPNYTDSNTAVLNAYYGVGYGDDVNYERYFDIAIKGAPDGTNGAGVIRFLANNATNNSNATELMRIHGRTGRVGIGTSSPGAALHVSGATSPRIFIESSANGYPGYELREAGSRKWILYNDNNDALILENNSGTGILSVVQTTGTVNINTVLSVPQICLNGVCSSSWSGGVSSAGGWTNTSTVVSLSTATNNISAGALVVDNTNSRVGIATTAQGAPLSVGGTAGAFGTDSLNFDYNTGSARIAAGSAAGSTSLALLTTASGAVTEKARIDSEGDVGIGITDPKYGLDVYEDDAGGGVNWALRVNSSGRTMIDFASGTEHVFLNLDSAHSNTYLPVISFKRLNVSYGEIGLARQSSSAGDGYNYEESQMVLGTMTNVPLAFKVNGIRRVTIGTNGFIGVNMTPQFALDINQSIGGQPARVRVKNGISSGYADLTLLNDANTAMTVGIEGTATNTGYFGSTTGDGYVAIASNLAVGTTTVHNLTLATNNTERIFINGTGGIGIGTTAPLVGKVEINGGVDAGTVSGGPSGNFMRSLVVYAEGGGGLEFGGLNTTGGSSYGVISTGNSGDGIVFNTRVAGTETARMVLSNGGNLGLATASPNYRLDVVAPTTQIRFGSAAADSGGYLISTSAGQAYIVGGSAWNGSHWVAKHTASSAMQATTDGTLRFYTNTGLTAGNTFSQSERMIINGSGSVGIGTSSPSARLHVQSVTGDVSEPAGIIIEGTGTGAKTWQISPSASETLLIATPGLRIAAFDATGKFYAGSLDGASGASATFTANATGVTVGRSYTTLSPPSNGAIIQGNVGINTSSPTSTLHVAGNATVTGNFYVGAFSPTSLTVGTGNSSFDTNVLYIDTQNDRVGAGTANPTEKLDVAGNIRVTGASYAIGFGDGTSNISRSSNDLQFRTSNNFAFIGGKVGIATTTPAHPLEVVGYARINGTGAGAGARLYFGDGGGHAAMRSFGIGINEQNYGEMIIYQSASQGSDPFTGSHRLSIGSTGNVGVGTAMPNSTLQVQGTMNVTNTAGDFFFVRPDSNGIGWGEAHLNGQGMALSMYSNPQGTTQTGTGSLSLPAQSAGIISDADTPLVLGAGASERMRITTSGNVGIGTATPSGKLEVTGNTVINGTSATVLTVNGGAGSTAGIVMNAASSSREAQIFFQQNAVDRWQMGMGSGTSPNWYVYSQGAGANVLTANYTTGYVGVATSTPQTRFQIGTVAMTNPNAVYNQHMIGLMNLMNRDGAADSYLINNGYYNNSGTWIRPLGGTSTIFSFNSAANVSFALSVANSSSAGSAINYMEAFRVNDGGNVGIGGVAPTAKLHVYGGNADGIYIQSNSSSADPNLRLGRGGSGQSDFMIRVRGSGLNSYLSIWDNNAGVIDTGIVLKGNNTGIGTTDPREKLQVAGNIRATTNALDWSSVDGMNMDYYAGVSAGRLQAMTGNAPGNISLNPSGGRVGVGTTSPEAQFHITSPNALSTVLKLTRTGATNPNWNFVMGDSGGFGHLYIQNANTGAYPIVLRDDGSVGINTTNPAYTLDITGTLRTTGGKTNFLADVGQNGQADNLEKGDLVSISYEPTTDVQLGGNVPVVKLRKASGRDDLDVVGVVFEKVQKDHNLTSTSGPEIRTGDWFIFATQNSITFLKASAENGPIVPGDYLMPANTPGYAMKADADATMLLGRSLDYLESGTDTINAFISLSRTEGLTDVNELRLEKYETLPDEYVQAGIVEPTESSKDRLYERLAQRIGVQEVAPPFQGISKDGKDVVISLG